MTGPARVAALAPVRRRAGSQPGRASQAARAGTPRPRTPGGMLRPVPRDELDEVLRELVAQAQQGDQGAFTDLFTRVAPVAFRMGRGRVTDPHVLEQLVHDAFLRATSAYDPARGPFLAFFQLKWRGAFDDHFKSRKSGRLGLSEPPRGPDRLLLAITGEDIADHPLSGNREWVDAPLARREWMLQWRPIRDKVAAQIEAEGGDPERQRCLRRALDVVALRALRFGMTDSELARELACDPKQAARYISYVHAMLRPYFSPKAET